MRRAWACLALLAGLSGLLPAARAAEPDHDGYLFRVEADAVLLAADAPGVEAVSPEHGLYRAETRGEALAFAGPEGAAWIEPNYYVTLLDGPDDPALGAQWSLEAVGLQAAWDRGLTGAGVRVGVVDSGLYAGHEELAGADILPGRNYMAGSLEEADPEDTSDTFGHGTFVSGVIAAGTDNGVGVAGLAPGVELVPLKCFEGKTGTVAAVVAAILGGVDDYACRILNLSFGLASDSTALREAVEHARAQGVLLVAAVGNAGTETLYYPAAYPGVVGVGSVGRTLAPAAATQHNDSVDLTAPGEKVLGLGIGGPDDYETGSGTSYAAPCVTAAAALALEAAPELTAEELAQLLCDSAEDLGAPGYDTSYGWGLLSLPALLERAAGDAPLTLEQSGGQLLLTGLWTGPAAGGRLWAAFYAGDRLLACREVAAEWTAEGARLDAALDIPSGAERVKLLALGAGQTPAAPPAELGLEPPPG